MKPLLIVISVLFALIVIVLIVLAHPAFGTFRPISKELIEQSPNYYRGMFHNQEHTPEFTGKVSMISTLREFLTAGDSQRIPPRPVAAVKTDLKALPRDKDWLVWFGHSSYLFNLGGRCFLVDPVLRLEYPASLMLKPFRGSELYTPDALPDIDVLIITHEHWDHMDYATIRDIRTKVKEVFCPLGIADYFRYWHYSDEQLHEQDWYDQWSGDYTITCLPCRHFSNRLLRKHNQTLWASFMVEHAGKKVYIGGDGGYDKHFAAIRERFGAVDLAFLENGQYNDNWKYIHTTPEDLEKVIQDLQPKQVFTVHHNKFALAMHPWDEPEKIAHSIALRHHFKLLDQPIGTVIYF